MLQNKKAGICQLVERIQQHNTKFPDDILRYTIVNKPGLTANKLSKIFNKNTMSGEIIITLCNPRQLNKVKKAIEKSINDTEIIMPYVCLIDEYDDLIKSRHDMPENSKKVTEKPAIYIQEKSFLSIGITATLLAIMLQEDKLTIHDILKLKTAPNYVGYNNTERLQLIDIDNEIIRKGKKTSLSNKTIRKIIYHIDCSLNDIKTYSIALFNITDKKEEHRMYCEEVKNEFPQWGVIKFHSNDDGVIYCYLPDTLETVSKIESYRPLYDKINSENQIRNINIIEHSHKIPHHKLNLITNRDEANYTKYSIEFTEFSIQEIITELLKYTQRIAIFSGRMATRGISFVNNDYSKHITDLIYVPSESSHVTRNVQDMRIYGNFPLDNIKLCLYIDEQMYKDNIKNYHELQTSILTQANNNMPIKNELQQMKFNSDELPNKKLDRLNVIKGFSFTDTDTWGIPSYINELEIVQSKLHKNFPNHKQLIYSVKYTIALKHPFEIPSKTIPNYTQLIKSYKHQFAQKLNLPEGIHINYIYSDFRQAWPLHNPLNINSNIDRNVPDICYKGDAGDCNIDIIHRKLYPNFSEHDITKSIIIFYGKTSYHYVICNENYSVINDKYE